MASDKITVKDSDGRVLEISPLDPADMLDLLEAAEGASSNAGFVRYAMVVCSVSAIDNVPVPRPVNKDGMKALARRLGNDGFAAVTKAMFGEPEKRTDDVAATAKN